MNKIRPGDIVEYDRSDVGTYYMCLVIYDMDCNYKGPFKLLDMKSGIVVKSFKTIEDVRQCGSVTLKQTVGTLELKARCHSKLNTTTLL